MAVATSVHIVHRVNRLIVLQVITLRLPNEFGIRLGVERGEEEGRGRTSKALNAGTGASMRLNIML